MVASQKISVGRYLWSGSILPYFWTIFSKTSLCFSCSERFLCRSRPYWCFWFFSSLENFYIFHQDIAAFCFSSSERSWSLSRVLLKVFFVFFLLKTFFVLLPFFWRLLLETNQNYVNYFKYDIFEFFLS